MQSRKCQGNIDYKFWKGPQAYILSIGVMLNFRFQREESRKSENSWGISKYPLDPLVDSWFIYDYFDDILIYKQIKLNSALSMHYFDIHIWNKILSRLCPGQIKIFAKLSRFQKFWPGNANCYRQYYSIKTIVY